MSLFIKAWLGITAGASPRRAVSTHHLYRAPPALTNLNARTTTGFEAVALLRVHVLHEKLSLVMPLHAKSPASFLPTWTFIATLLLLVRLSQVASTRSRDAWRTTALVHLAEAAYYAWLGFASDAAPLLRLLGTAPFNAARDLPIAVVSAGIVLNAVIFTFCWLATPGSSGSGAAKAKNA